MILNHMKRCSTSLTREIQIKTILKYHFTHQIGNITNCLAHSVGRSVNKQVLSYIPGGNTKWHNPFGGEFGNM